MCLFVFSRHVVAATATWNVDADGFWATNGNWNAVHPDSAVQDAFFVNVITADRTITDDIGTLDLGKITFDSASGYDIVSNVFGIQFRLNTFGTNLLQLG